MTDHRTFARSFLFNDLPLHAREMLAARAVVRTYAAGAAVWRAGDTVGHLAVVLSGAVRVVREGRGRQQVLHSEGPGGTLGEVPLFSGGKAPATVLATARTECLIIPRAAIDAAIHSEPAVAWLFLQRMADRVRLLVERVDSLSLQSATARLGAFLLGRVGDVAGGVLVLGMTHTELAAELGTVREVVGRGLRMLKQRGLIASAGRGRLQILDLAALRSLTYADETLGPGSERGKQRLPASESISLDPGLTQRTLS
jgi:CRP-like cAMP-binding protein